MDELDFCAFRTVKPPSSLTPCDISAYVKNIIIPMKSGHPGWLNFLNMPDRLQNLGHDVI
jgi:hypothetical protein